MQQPEPIKYIFTLKNGVEIPVSHYADRDGFFDVMYSDHSREIIPSKNVKSIDPCYSEEMSGWVLRNQANRFYKVLLRNSKYTLIYYIMPKGALYLNKFTNDGYSTISVEAAVKLITTDVQRQRFEDMLEDQLSTLEDLMDTESIRHYDYEDKVAINNSIRQQLNEHTNETSIPLAAPPDGSTNSQ